VIAPATQSLTLPILGMTCASCQHHVQAALSSAPGVQSAHVDLMANRATVVFDPTLATPQSLLDAVRGAGYDAVLPRTGQDAPSAPPTPEHSSLRVWATLSAGAAAMLLSMPLDSSMDSPDRALMDLLPWL